MDKEIEETVRQNILKIIEDRGLVIYKIGQKAGIPKTSFYDLIHGRRRINVSDLWKISVVLDVTPDKLCGLESKT